MHGQYDSIYLKCCLKNAWRREGEAFSKLELDLPARFANSLSIICVRYTTTEAVRLVVSDEDRNELKGKGTEKKGSRP